MKRGRESKLNDGVIERIAEYIRLHMKMKDIAEILGLNPDTIRRWIRAGEKAKTGIKRRLVDAIASARAEAKSELTQIVFNAALIGAEEVTEKEVTLPDGTTRRERITKHIPPNPAYALKVLARKYPEEWADIQHIRVDWRESILGIGLNPEHLEKDFFRQLEDSEQNGTAKPVIPMIPDKVI